MAAEEVAQIKAIVSLEVRVKTWYGTSYQKKPTLRIIPLLHSWLWSFFFPANDRVCSGKGIIIVAFPFAKKSSFLETVSCSSILQSNHWSGANERLFNSSANRIFPKKKPPAGISPLLPHTFQPPLFWALWMLVNPVFWTRLKRGKRTRDRIKSSFWGEEGEGGREREIYVVSLLCPSPSFEAFSVVLQVWNLPKPCSQMFLRTC